MRVSTLDFIRVTSFLPSFPPSLRPSFPLSVLPSFPPSNLPSFRPSVLPVLPSFRPSFFPSFPPLLPSPPSFLPPLPFLPSLPFPSLRFPSLPFPSPSFLPSLPDRMPERISLECQNKYAIYTSRWYVRNYVRTVLPPDWPWHVASAHGSLTWWKIWCSMAHSPVFSQSYGKWSIL